jgi:predicted nucleotide-binding protein
VIITISDDRKRFEMARRPTQPPPAPKKTMTTDELRNGIKRLQTRIEELEAFDPNKMTENRPAELQGLSTSIQTTLARVFGDGTPDYQRFLPACELQWSPGFYISGMTTPLSDYIKGVAKNREYSLAQLRGVVRTLEEDLAEHTAGSETEPIPIRRDLSRKVFLVHGRDDGAKSEVARFLSKIGLEEIILHERPNAGRHLLTKFQEESEGASFAVVLITPDDEGSLSGGAPRKRARQNVVFELGFFIGKFGIGHVAALVKGDVEKPSDFEGVGYITLDPGGAWKGLLAREMKAAKVPFDPHKVFEA